MVQCVVDGCERYLPPGDMNGLAAVIDALCEDVCRDGRFIASLKVDGRELDASTEWYLPRSLNDIRVIEVTTGLSSQLASEALKQGELQLDELRSVLHQTVACFRSGDDQRGMEHFIALIGGYEWFVAMIKSVGDIIQIDLASTIMDGRPLSTEVDAMNQILLDIISAQESRDWVLLVDLLEYELEPQMDRWRKVLAMIGQDTFV